MVDKEFEKELKHLRDEIGKLMDGQDSKLKAIAGDHAEIMKQIIERVKKLEVINLHVGGDVDGNKEMVEKQDEREQRGEIQSQTSPKYMFS